MNRKGYLKTNNIILSYSVLAMLLTSGGGYLNSILLLIVATMLILIREKKIVVSKRAASVGLCLIAYITLNSAIFNRTRFIPHDYVIHLLRIVCLMLIVEKIGIHEFKKTFVDVIIALSILSLFWYTLLMISPNMHIPFEINGAYVGSFYHIIGFSRRGHTRNAGIFWEPGVFQIYINLAIALLTIEPNLVKQPIRKFIILTITLLTTLSTGGYLAFALIMAFTFFRQKGSKTAQRLKGLLIPAIFVFAVIESQTGIISNKLINRGSSFASRHDDLLLGYQMFRGSPILGTGIVAERNSIRNTISVAGLLYNDQTRLANSNGLINVLAQGGLFFFIPYLLAIYCGFKRWTNNNRLTTIEFFILAILALINEPIGFTPFWLSFFFSFSAQDRFLKSDEEEK